MCVQVIAHGAHAVRGKGMIGLHSTAGTRDPDEGDMNCVDVCVCAHVVRQISIGLHICVCIFILVCVYVQICV